MAISKKHKVELINQYSEWVSRSKALIMTEYVGLSMPQIDVLRAKIRETGGEFHIVKNTLGKLALEQAGFSIPENFITGSTAVVFAFEDAPATAKAVIDYAKTSEVFKLKGGYLNGSSITSESVKALAELPPLPVMRAQLLGTLMAPASKLVRTLSEPGRQIAAVIKAYSEPEAAAAAA